MIIQPLPSAKTVIPLLPVAMIPQRPPAITTTKQTNNSIFTVAPFFKGAIFFADTKKSVPAANRYGFYEKRII